MGLFQVLFRLFQSGVQPLNVLFRLFQRLTILLSLLLLGQQAGQLRDFLLQVALLLLELTALLPICLQKLLQRLLDFAGRQGALPDLLRLGGQGAVRRAQGAV